MADMGVYRNSVATTLESPLVCPVLVGRDACIAAIDRTLDDVQAGRGRTQLISGEAGISKSRLIAALRDRAAAAALFQGSCFERDHSLPYAPVVDALRTLCGGLEPVAALQRLGPHLAALLPELGITSGAQDDPEQAQQQVVQSLVQLLKRAWPRSNRCWWYSKTCTGATPRVWPFSAFSRRLRDAAVLLLGTYRDDEEHTGLAILLAELERARLSSALHLTRLDPGNVEAMLRSILGSTGGVRSSLVHRLYELTDGNPFFVEEVLRSLVALTPGSSAPRWEDVPLNELRLPRSVQDAVQRRTDRLSPTGRQLMVLAAIAGRRFQFPLLQQLTELDEGALLVGIKELISAQLVVEESAETFAFRHALTRQAIHAALLARERRVIHRRIATVLEQQSGDERLEDLAHHFFEAG
jgi:predicted ATPase